MGKKVGERCPEEWEFVRRMIEAKQNHNERNDMNTQSTTSEYLLLFRGTHWDKNLSPEELQNVMSQWSAWYDRLIARGKIKSAQPLMDEGKIVTWKKGQTVADGPFAESKEAIGGYFLLEISGPGGSVGNCQRMPDAEIRGDGRSPAGGPAVRALAKSQSAFCRSDSLNR